MTVTLIVQCVGQSVQVFGDPPSVFGPLRAADGFVIGVKRLLWLLQTILGDGNETEGRAGPGRVLQFLSLIPISEPTRPY